MKIVTAWFLWSLHLKLCLIQFRSCFCILSLWMSSIILKRGFVSVLMWTLAYAPKRWVQNSCSFHFRIFFLIIEPWSTEHLGLFSFILSYLTLFFPSNQYCLRPFPWFSLPPTAPLSIAKQDCTPKLSPGARTGIDFMKGNVLIFPLTLCFYLFHPFCSTDTIFFVLQMKNYMELLSDCALHLEVRCSWLERMK